MSYTKFTTLPTLCIVEKLEGGRYPRRGGSRIPRGRGTIPLGGDANIQNLPDFPQKKHEIKKILVRRGAQGTPPLLRSASGESGAAYSGVFLHISV